MFTDFTPVKRSLFKERVNSFLGIAFLGTCGLWAALFMWNVANGTNPIEHAVAAAVERTISISK